MGVWASHDKLLFWEGGARSFVHKAASFGVCVYVCVVQGVAVADGADYGWGGE